MTLSGNSISSLSQLPSSQLPTLTATSTYAFVAASRDKYQHDEYHTAYATSKDLFSSIIQQASSYLSLGSMSAKDSKAYSPKSHIHTEYNKLQFQYKQQKQTQFLVDQYNALCNVSQLNNDHPNSLSIGNLYVDGILSTVYVPMSWVQPVVDVSWQPIEPTFGTVKPAALPTKREIVSNDVIKDNFDGWLWLDGYTTYPLSAFRLSNEINAAPFVTFDNPTASIAQKTFKTKSLNTFISANNTADAFTNVPAVEVLQSHNHKINLSVQYTLSIDGSISTSNDTLAEGIGKSIHIGTGWAVKDKPAFQSKEDTTYYKTKNSNGTYTGKIINGEKKSFNVGCYNIAISENEYSSVCTQVDGTPLTVWYIPDMCYLTKSSTTPAERRFLNYSWQDIWTSNTDANIDNVACTNKVDIDLRCRFGFDSDQLNVLRNAEINGNTYPSHNLVPFMVYVGRRQETH